MAVLFTGQDIAFQGIAFFYFTSDNSRSGLGMVLAIRSLRRWQDSDRGAVVLDRSVTSSKI